MKWNIVEGSAYKGRSLGVDGQEMVNLYPETNGPLAKNTTALRGTPGLFYLNAIGQNSGCRGLYVTARDRLLMVVGNKLYEVSPFWSYSVLGNLNSISGPVTFAEMDKQLDPTSSPISHVMLVDGVNGYILNTLTNDFTIITGDYIPGSSVIAQNGFFIQNCNDSNKFIFSNQYDGLTWEASLNFFSAESSPDPILYITLINNQVWLYGSKTIEIWNFTGNPNELWQRSGIGYLMTGLIGRNAATNIMGQVVWIGSGKDGQNIVWLSGSSYTPQRISTHAIEYIIGTLGDINDCMAMSYVQEGHQFVLFNFPVGNRTLCYDLTTDLWHERGILNPSTGLNERHRAMYLAAYQGKILVGDDANNFLYYWDLGQYTDNGATIKRVRVCPHIHKERQRVFFHQAEIDIEKGTALQDSSRIWSSVTANFSWAWDDTRSDQCEGPEYYTLTNSSTPLSRIDGYLWGLGADATCSDSTTGAGPINVSYYNSLDGVWPGRVVSLFVKSKYGNDSTSVRLPY